jgi:hypothetical protein
MYNKHPLISLSIHIVEVYFCARELHEKYAFFTKIGANTKRLEYGINYHDIDTRMMTLVLFMANLFYDWRHDDAR